MQYERQEGTYFAEEIGETCQQVMFQPMSNFRSAGLLAALHKNYLTDFHKAWMEHGSHHRIEPVKFLAEIRIKDRCRIFFPHFL